MLYPILCTERPQWGHVLLSWTSGAGLCSLPPWLRGLLGLAAGDAWLQELEELLLDDVELEDGEDKDVEDEATKDADDEVRGWGEAAHRFHSASSPACHAWKLS